MSEVAARYRRLSGDFVDKVSQVSPERWDAQSPCDEWAARDVVAHIVDVHGIFLGLVGRPFERTVDVDNDPVAATREAAAQVQADLDAPERASEEFDGYFGRMTFEGHGWDLARAAGLDEAIPPAEIVRLQAAVEAFGDALHQSGVCGPAVEVAADADDQTKLLARVGRHV